MDDIKISVIIPVFNAENSIETCLNSIIKQTLKEIEIICIDDGSSDNSLEILKQFSEHDNRIKIFSKENSGSGLSRNLGIYKAKGDYIAFLDSDDYIVDENAYYELYSKVNDGNYLMGSGNIQFLNKGNVEFGHSGFNPVTEVTIKKSEDYGIPWYFYKNIFNRLFLVENNIKFPNLLRGQDPIFLTDILTKIDVFIEVPIMYYSYTVPTEEKINNPLKYIDYYVHFYKVFKILMTQKRFDSMIKNFTNILIRMKNRAVYINNEKELFSLLNIMDKITMLFAEYGDENLINGIHGAFDEIIDKIDIGGFNIFIDYSKNFGDFYSKRVIIFKNKTL